jgi:hypothetical protein
MDGKKNALLIFAGKGFFGFAGAGHHFPAGRINASACFGKLAVFLYKHLYCDPNPGKANQNDSKE